MLYYAPFLHLVATHKTVVLVPARWAPLPSVTPMGHVMLGRDSVPSGASSRRGGGLVGQEEVGAVGVHFCCKMLDYGLCLHVQVPDHGVAVPSAEHFDKVLVRHATQ
jgi:hypothetical protein